MKPSFKAQVPNGPSFTWSASNGFKGELSDLMNAELATSTGQTHIPPAILAQAVLLQFWPDAEVTDFVSPPLETLPEDTEC